MMMMMMINISNENMFRTFSSPIISSLIMHILITYYNPLFDKKPENHFS